MSVRKIISKYICYLNRNLQNTVESCIYKILSSHLRSLNSKNVTRKPVSVHVIGQRHTMFHFHRSVQTRRTLFLSHIPKSKIVETTYLEISDEHYDDNTLVSFLPPGISSLTIVLYERVSGKTKHGHQRVSIGHRFNIWMWLQQNKIKYCIV